ncbi:hypothetical protein A3J41_02485 [candidate division TM6 bacterium RIFCSPHIGHO2_12_FULL_38_8]|nr:MAG: hypothetical protein A3J41_02485 [candidate division TM6 bacterium RIFCSPHIGHO2_12_FULL_38_8]
MKLVTKIISVDELKIMSEKMFGKLVKAVVDIEREIMAVDAELHVDLEELLLENESEQDALWGINFHPNKFPSADWVEFDSMINVRPLQANMSRYVENEQIRKKILTVVSKLVQA